MKLALQQFKTESKRILDLMVNSIYTHKEIFLRELISNASDAIDKLYYRELSEGTAGMAHDEFKIELIADKPARKLTVRDNGCGMSKEELKQNLGTIADSGTLRFRSENQLTDETAVIGQFGVGFYSAFMVAKRITVQSRAYGAEEAWQWESAGAEGFTVRASDKADFGTDVILELRDDTEDEHYSEFLDDYRLARLVKKFSDYIRYPIRMERRKSRLKEGTEHEYEDYTEIETLNSMVPLWKRNKAELQDEDYNRFYEDKFSDYEAPLHRVHMSAEGLVSYNALLFFPARAPYNYYTKEFEKGLQLYANGVLIMDKCADLLPDYFSFVKGLVDSPDLSLNISREMLQHDRQLKVIAGNIEKKIKNELANLLKNDREQYEKLFEAFGLQLKYGVYAGFGRNKETLQDLLLFHSMVAGKPITLREYVDGMPEGQKSIYYAAGGSAARIGALPQLELVKEKGYDVLFLTEDVDEFAVQMLHEYDGKAFQSVTDGDLGLADEAEQKAAEEQAEAHKELLACLREQLGSERVADVRLSTRLKSHPVCLSADGGLTIGMEKVLNAMPAGEKVKAQRVLELNPAHPVFEKLTALYADEGEREKLRAYGDVLYTQALLQEGILPEDPAAYGEALWKLI